MSDLCHLAYHAPGSPMVTSKAAPFPFQRLSDIPAYVDDTCFCLHRDPIFFASTSVSTYFDCSHILALGRNAAVGPGAQTFEKGIDYVPFTWYP